VEDADERGPNWRQGLNERSRQIALALLGKRRAPRPAGRRGPEGEDVNSELQRAWILLEEHANRHSSALDAKIADPAYVFWGSRAGRASRRPHVLPETAEMHDVLIGLCPGYNASVFDEWSRPTTNTPHAHIVRWRDRGRPEPSVEVPRVVPAIEQRFRAVIERRHNELLAYARRRLNEPTVAARDDRQDGSRTSRTRFAAEECVNEAVADLLESGGYERCESDDEMTRFLTRTVTHRIEREFRERKLRQERHQPLPHPRDDAWDEESSSRSGWQDSRDDQAFFEETPTDESEAEGRNLYVPSNVPAASVYAKIKDRLENAIAARLDLKRAFEEEKRVEEVRPGAQNVQIMLLPAKYRLTWPEVRAYAKSVEPNGIRAQLLYETLRRDVQAARDRLRAQKRLEAYAPETHKPPTEGAETAYSRRWWGEFRAEFRKALRLRRSFCP
jgi:hypothetical protein